MTGGLMHGIKEISREFVGMHLAEKQSGLHLVASLSPLAHYNNAVASREAEINMRSTLATSANTYEGHRLHIS